MKKLKQMYRCMEERMYRNSKTTRCPTKTFGHDRQCGFTLVELVIVIAIVIILSVISVPIYRGYVDKSKMAEGYALGGSIVSAQKAYYSEYGYFLDWKDSCGWTRYDTTLGIDARGNKYFTEFSAADNYDSHMENMKVQFDAEMRKPLDMRDNGKSRLIVKYNITRGTSFYEVD